MRKIISEMINEEPGFEVIAVARDGEDGVKKAIELKPDIITLDIEMPRKDGLTALREIKIKCHDFNPMVLMCSSLTVAGSNETFKALRIGAADFIAKDPSLVGQHDAGFREELVSKLKAFSSHHAPCKTEPKTATAQQSTERGSSPDAIDLSRVKAIVVGSSTGGPPVLEEIFSSIPKDLHVPIIVAQHMPELFTRSLANRLDQHCACSAKIVENGAILSTPGIHIALGGTHTRPLKVAGGKIVARHIEQIQGATYRPSVDELFNASSEIWGDSLLAIQLTGMGADGAKGAEKIKAAGGQVIAQLGCTCVVNGMPKAVIDKNAAHAVMTPKDIQSLLSKVGGGVSGAIGTKPPNPRRLRSA